jgi:MFS family permease
MNPIRTIRRLVGMLTGLAAALAAAVAGAPAAFAQPYPQPGQLSKYEPVAHPFNGVTGGMTGWQIALIAVGAAIVGAVAGVLLDRARAARGHRPATAT